jgi:hypothetical protein
VEVIMRIKKMRGRNENEEGKEGMMRVMKQGNG